MRSGYLDCFLAIDLQMMVACNFPDLVPADLGMAVACHLLQLVALNDQMTILPDPLFPIILDPNVHVLFAMDEDLFAALLVFYSKLIEAAATLRAHRLQRALGLLGGQCVRRHLLRVVDTPGDDRP